MLQEEIELHGDAISSGLILCDEMSHLLIHVLAGRNVAFHITAEEREVYFTSLQFSFLEIAFVDQMLAQGFVDDPHRMHIVRHSAIHPPPFALLHSFPILERLVDERLG